MHPSRLVNGNPDPALSAVDRGFLYGDGLFETIALLHGRAPLWQDHWARLALGAQRLGLPDPSESVFLEDLELLLGQKRPQKAVLRLQYTAGPGGRGLSRPNKVRATRVSALLPFPERPAGYWRDGVRLLRCETRLSEQPRLAGIKHCNRLEYVLARQEWSDEDVPEGLLLDASGYIAEGTVSNLFAVRNGLIQTPALKRCGVHGVMRLEVIRQARALGIPVEQGDYRLEDWKRADELFVTNSLIGVWPVRQLDGCNWSVGPVTRRLQQALREVGLIMIPDT